MSLLNSFFGNADQTQALGLLGAYLMAGQAPQGFQAATSLLAEAPMRKKRESLLDMQIEETKAQGEERRAKIDSMKRQQENDAYFLGVGQPGGAGSSSAPQGPFGGLTAQQISAQYNIPIEAVVSDYRFNGGKKLAELINDRAKPNWQNINGNLVNTNAPGFKGGFQPGMSVSNDGRAVMWQPDGQGGMVFGAPRGALETYGAYRGVDEGAKAGYDLVQVIGSDGAARYVPRSQVVQGARQPQMPQVSPQGAPQVTPDEQRARDAESIRMIQAELQQERNPTARVALERELARLTTAQARPGFPTPTAVNLPSAGGFQATPTTAQIADAAAAKARAEADAKAESERQAGRTKKSDSATEMLRQLDRAENLLMMGPTASGAGALVDKGLSTFGVTTSGSQIASSLENIAGWLTANVPRMEGPQSNFDVENYKLMAGRVGDRTLPVAERMAALQEVRTIQQRYAGSGGGESAPAQSRANVVNELPKSAPKGTRARDTATGKVMVFNGLSWVAEK